MLVIAYGMLALIGVGVYLIGYCFFELSQIRSQIVVANETRLSLVVLAAEANKLAAEANEINNDVQQIKAGGTD